MGGRGAGSGGSNAATAKTKKLGKSKANKQQKQLKQSKTQKKEKTNKKPAKKQQKQLKQSKTQKKEKTNKKPAKKAHTELKGKKEKEYTAKTSEKYKKTVTDKEVKAAREYQAAAYRTVNKNLRTGKKLDKDDKNTVKHLDKAIGKNKIGKNTVLYRGLKQNEINQLIKTKAGTTIKDKGFISTSTSKSRASTFARGDFPNTPKSVIAQYNVKSNTKGIHVPSMNKSRGTQSIKDKEKEVILGRNTKAVFKGFNKRGNTVIAQFDIH